MDTHPNYELLEEIGRGSLAAVYRARDLGLKRYVAVKALHEKFRRDPRQMEQFWQEAQFLAGLRHDNIVQIHGLDKERGWIILELMRGSLDAKLAAGPLPPDLVRSVLRQALAALEHLHAQGKFHGGVKPGNLLIDDTGRVKLSDSAGVATGGEVRRPAGSTKYLAPELLNPAFGEVGPGVDLYCLGFTAVELLLGPRFDRQFKGVGADAIDADLAWMRWHSAQGERLPPVKELAPAAPADLCRVIDKLLNKPVADRYASAAEALRDLEDKPLVLVDLPTGPAARTGAAATAGPAVLAVGGAAPVPPRPPVPRPPAARPGAAKPRAGKKSLNDTLKQPKVLYPLLALLLIPAVIFFFWEPGETAEMVPVTFETTPPGATVTIDGTKTPKKTPAKFEMKPGEYKVLFELEGHKPHEVTVTVKAEADAKPFQYALNKIGDDKEKIAGKRKMPIHTVPPDAEVFINEDQVSLGKTNGDFWVPEEAFTLRLVWPDKKEVIQKVDPKQQAVKVTQAKTDPVAQLLEIRTTPTGASIFIDKDLQAKKAPASIALKPGTYKIRATMADHEDAVREVTILADKVPPPLDLTLKPVKVVLKPGTRKLPIHTVPEGAEVFINAEKLSRGKTNGDFIVPEEAFTLRLVWPDKKEVTQKIDPKQQSVKVEKMKDEPFVQELEIRTTPSGATLFIDNKQQDKKSPATFALKPGTYKVKATKEEFEDGVRDVVILPDGKQPPLELFLKPVKVVIKPALRKLLIKTAPFGAAVFVKGVKQKQTTDGIFEVPAEPFELRLELPNYLTATQQVTAKQVEVVVALKPLLAEGGKADAPLKGHTQPVHALAFTPNGTGLASAELGQEVRLWDVRKGTVLWKRQGAARALAVNPTGISLVTGETDGQVTILSTATGSEIVKRAGDKTANNGVAFGPGGKLIASAREDGTIQLFNGINGAPLGTLKDHQGPVRAVAFHPNGQQLASAGADKVIRLWNLGTKKPEGQLPGHLEEVTALAFNKDGSRLLSASADKTLGVWDVAKRQLVVQIVGHTGRVNAAAFRPDGGLIASGSDDRTLRLWDAATGKQLGQLSGHEEPVLALAFSPNGKTLASADGAVIRLWQLNDKLAMTPPAPRRHALLVGVGQPGAQLPHFLHAEADMAALGRVLRLSGYGANQVQELIQGRAKDAPTVERIRQALAALTADCTITDTVVLALAGHVVSFPDQQGSYFCPADSDLTDKATLLPLAEVYDRLAQCPGQNRLILVDGWRNDPFPPPELPGGLTIVRDRVKEEPADPGVVVLASCSPMERGGEQGNHAHGLFFYTVLRGLQGAADDDRNNAIPLGELAEYVKKQVPAQAQREGGLKQTPEVIGEPENKDAVLFTPAEVLGQVNEGLVALEEKQYDKAITAFDAAESKDAAYVELFAGRSLAHYARGRTDPTHFDKALQDSERVLKLDPRNLAALHNLAGLHVNRAQRQKDAKQRAEEFKKAVAFHQQEIKLAPQWAAAHNALGVTWALQRDYDRAVLCYSEAIRLNARGKYAYENRGNAYRQKGDYENALKDLDRAIEINPNNPLTYERRGNTYRILKKLDQALADLDKAIELDRKAVEVDKTAEKRNANYLDSRGQIQFARKEYDDAIRDFTDALEIQEDEVTLANRAYAYNEKGVLNKDRELFDKAFQDVTRALKLSPEYTPARYLSGAVHYNQAVLTREKKLFMMAIQDFNTVLARQPRHAAALYQRGLSRQALGMKMEGAADVKKALEINPNINQDPTRGGPEVRAHPPKRQRRFIDSRTDHPSLAFRAGREAAATAS